MGLNTSIGYVRIKMKSVGVDEPKLLASLEEVRLRLRCKECSKNYVVASSEGGSISCPCGTAMLQVDQSNDRGGYLWLEKRWECRKCKFEEVVRFLLEHGLASLWLENSSTMAMRPVRLLSA